MKFSPIDASNEIEQKYIRYLSTVFGISDDHYARQFQEQLSDKKMFSAGPFLDVTDSFVKGKSISELIQEGFVNAGFSEINMPLDRPLYKHQEKALKSKRLIFRR